MRLGLCLWDLKDITSFHWEVRRKAQKVTDGNHELPKGQLLKRLTTAYKEADIAALFGNFIMFFERQVGSRIKHSRVCDARIESILLDVNTKEEKESMW